MAPETVEEIKGLTIITLASLAAIGLFFMGCWLQGWVQ